MAKKLTVAIIYIFPKVSKAIPSTLAAIIFTTAVVFFLGIDTKTVGDLGSIAGGIPEFNFPLVPGLIFCVYPLFISGYSNIVRRL